MFLRIENITNLDRLGRKSHAKIGYFMCDQCGREFTKRRTEAKIINSPRHFCGRKCLSDSSRKGGALDIAKRETCKQKYGTEHHLKNPEIQQKRLDTCERLFGGRAPMSSRDVQEKTAKTNEERYGGHFSKNPDVKQKKRDTCLRKYGVDSFSKTSEFKDGIDWQDLTRRGFETRKKAGIAKISKIERAFGDFLKKYFDLVETQVEINNWWMDFFIPSINTYVQFDGDYWHGLNVSLNELLESDKPQNRVIAGTKIRDAQREQWFAQQGLRLVRVRESEFKKKLYDQILNTIRGGQDGLQTV